MQTNRISNVKQYLPVWEHMVASNIGTAMGTAYTCIYATIFCYFEKYKNNLLLYSRQINDIFGIWMEDKSWQNKWNKFKHDLNNQYKHERNIKELSNKVNSLNLAITINKQDKLSYQTFQKHIKPLSLHSRSFFTPSREFEELDTWTYPKIQQAKYENWNIQ